MLFLSSRSCSGAACWGTIRSVFSATKHTEPVAGCSVVKEGHECQVIEPVQWSGLLVDVEHLDFEARITIATWITRPGVKISLWIQTIARCDAVVDADGHHFLRPQYKIIWRHRVAVPLRNVQQYVHWMIVVGLELNGLLKLQISVDSC